MFINKIDGLSQNMGFKSINHRVNDVGENVKVFNYLYDWKDENETCEIVIYRAKKLDNGNYKIDKKPIKTIILKPGGREVNLQNETNLGKDEDFFIEVIRKDKAGNVIWHGADTGVKSYEINDGELGFRKHLDYIGGTSKLAGPEYEKWQYTLITQNGTTPMNQGPACLAMPDTFMPGMRYRRYDEEGTGELVYDPDYQRKMEGMVKTTSNMYGGSIAGIEAEIPRLKKELGITKMPTTPFANGDNRTSHGYYNKNNKQMQENMGNSENYDSLMRTEFKHGISHIYDATLTSQGIEGINVRHALKWGDKSQFYRMFKMSGLKEGGISFGVLPTDAKNVRFRVINPLNNHEKQQDGTYKPTHNDYKYNQSTLIQIYDGSQVSEEQLSRLDEEIDMYRELTAGKNLDITSYHDTTISYVFEINPNEYEKNINNINELIKDGKKIELNSIEGALVALNFSNFNINKTSAGYVAWDDNADMLKVNYGVSASDEKELQGIVDRAERQHELDLRIRASKEAQDMAVQSLVYWADRTKTAHTLYAANVIGNKKSADEINKLIKDGLLPELPDGNEITQKVVDNIIKGEYNLAPKGILPKDDVTVKALMKLPLDSLEFGENTVGVLATSYFTNLATTDDTIGVSRYDLMKQGNPHLIDEYAKLYNKTNKIFTNDLKDFTDSVIKKVNETSATPLLTSDGNYTEFGEYVVELLAGNIAKYALLKSLAGDSFGYKILSDGTITYDYKNIKKATTLRALGIVASNPEEEASKLQKKIKTGLKNLNAKDVDALAKSISMITKGKNEFSYRLAEAFVGRSGIGLDFRFDAAKDTKDMDAIRNRDADVNDSWTDLIDFYKKCIKAIKSVNPYSYTVAEMTDIPDLFRATYGGGESCPYNGWTNVNGAKYDGEPDAMTKFYNETGITSEAAYSYFFTELLVNFSKEFERGSWGCDTHDAFKQKYDLLINTRSADYLRNLYTFIGNHDKTRTIHGLAVDMSLFHSTLMYNGADFNTNHKQRLDVMQVLSGAHNVNEIPLELRLNSDNLDYFRTVSSRAIAQSKLLMDSVDNDLKGIATEGDIKLLREALIDLANGNYMVSKTSEKATKINIPEISSIENAVREIAGIAKNNGVILSETEIKTIISNINKLNLDDYTVRGDFNWEVETERNGKKQKIGDINKEYLREINGTDSNAMDYSLYTVQIARMIKEGAKNTKQAEAINNALKDFVSTYNREKISNNMTGLKMFEDFAIARKKDSYAAQDFRVALEEAINQAEFKSGRKISNKEEIITTVFNSITEPAIKKQAMLLSFLGGLCGIPTIFAGDEYGDTGYEDKSKNPTVRNRMATRRSEMDRNTLMGRIMNRNKSVTYDALKYKATIKPLQNGTPYVMDVMAEGKSRDEILARISEIDNLIKDLPKDSAEAKKLQKERNILKLHLAKVAYIMQSVDGDMAISVFNAGGIHHDSRHNYYEDFGLKTKDDVKRFMNENNIESINPENPYIPIQEKTSMDAILMGAGVTIPIGTIFINADARDKAKYVVEKINGKTGIVRKEGSRTAKIVMDGLTAKNGVMILKKLKNIAFRGSQGVYNQQYNLIPNSYTKNETNELGKALSIVAS